MGIGYQGYMKLAGNQVLVTGGGIDLVQDPIYSNAAWGAGWKNAAPAAHYADAILRYEGTVDVELQLGIWSTLADWIVTNRITAKTLVFSPDGSKVFTYTAAGTTGGAFNTSAGFSTSEGSAVTVSLGVMAFSRAIAGGSSYIANKTGLIAAACPSVTGTNPLNKDITNLNPVPFWQTSAEIVGAPQAGLKAVEWSVDVSQNTVVVYTCKKTKLPRAVLQGSMDVTGSVIMYHPDGVFDPVADATMGAYNTSFVVRIGSGLGAATMTIPAVVIESDGYDISGMEGVTNRSFSMKGLAGAGAGPASPLLLA